MNILQATYDGSTFQIGGQSLSCPEPLRNQLEPSQGQRFDLGIRPEHVHISSEANAIRVEVNLVEPLGRETLVRAVFPGEEPAVDQTVNIQVAPGNGLQLGDRLSLSFDFDRLFVFDPATGNTLYGGVR